MGQFSESVLAHCLQKSLEHITRVYVCALVFMYTQAQLASRSRAISAVHVKKMQGDHYSALVLLRWSSKTRSPAAAQQHSGCVFVI